MTVRNTANEWEKTFRVLLKKSLFFFFINKFVCGSTGVHCTQCITIQERQTKFIAANQLKFFFSIFSEYL